MSENSESTEEVWGESWVPRPLEEQITYFQENWHEALDKIQLLEQQNDRLLLIKLRQHEEAREERKFLKNEIFMLQSQLEMLKRKLWTNRVNKKNVSISSIIIGLLAIGLFLLPKSEAFLLGEKFVKRPHQATFSVDNLCSLCYDPIQHPSAVRYIDNKPITSTCKSAAAWEYDFCVLRHEHLLRIIEQMPTVVTRHKRNILLDSALEEALVLSKIVLSAATNWINGLTANIQDQNPIERAKQLQTHVRTDSMNLYQNQSIVPIQVLRDDIAQVYVFAGRRQSELDRTIHSRAYEDRFLGYYHEEFSAAEVLLLSISKHLEKGKMDTEAQISTASASW